MDNAIMEAPSLVFLPEEMIDAILHWIIVIFGIHHVYIIHRLFGVCKVFNKLLRSKARIQQVLQWRWRAYALQIITPECLVPMVLPRDATFTNNSIMRGYKERNLTYREFIRWKSDTTDESDKTDKFLIHAVNTGFYIDKEQDQIVYASEQHEFCILSFSTGEVLKTSEPVHAPSYGVMHKHSDGVFFYVTHTHLLRWDPTANNVYKIELCPEPPQDPDKLRMFRYYAPIEVASIGNFLYVSTQYGKYFL